MTSIKGPKSALTDFIKSHKLKPTKKTRYEPHLRKKVVPKKVQYTKQKELSTVRFKSLEDTCIEQIMVDLHSHSYTDASLQAISMYLARKRFSNKYYFDFILSKVSSKFYFYDCANIKAFCVRENESREIRSEEQQKGGQRSEEMSAQYRNLETQELSASKDIEFDLIDKDHGTTNYIPSITKFAENGQYFERLTDLVLHFCGQLTENELDYILEKTQRLVSLTLKGAYLIEDIRLPHTVKNIDLSHCSRLRDDFINKLNAFGSIDSLRLSYCYGLTKNVRLTISVKELYICETFLDLESILSMKDVNGIEKLSLKNCCNIFPTIEKNAKNDTSASDIVEDLEHTTEKFFSIFDNLTYLDIEGISTITELNMKSTLRYLNVTNCFDFDLKSITNQENLEEVNLSRINKVDFDVLITFKKIQVLNISWCEELTDDVIAMLVTELTDLHTIYVFGCFNLTQNATYMAQEVRKCIKIIGNHTETGTVAS